MENVVKRMFFVVNRCILQKMCHKQQKGLVIGQPFQNCFHDAID